MGVFAENPGSAKEMFAATATELILALADAPVSERIKAVDQLTEMYLADMGEAPPGIQLERLANLILRDELAAMKKPGSEYPVMSQWQDERRERRQTKFVER